MRRTAIIAATVTALVAGGAAIIATGTAQAASTGVWKVSCDVSHSATDDPIVFPGKPGATHLHDFWGNRSVDANSTLENMLGKASTCPAGDTAGYWAPALYRNGVKINPAFMLAYYINPVSDDQPKVQAFPPGFKMVFGKSATTTIDGVPRDIRWGCSNNTKFGKEPPDSCSTKAIQVRYEFPSCWNGKLVDGDQVAAGTVRHPGRSKCPPGFDIPLPTMRMNIGYAMGSEEVGEITMSSGNRFSVHADFINTWDQAKLQKLVDDCHNGHKNCGHFKGSTPAQSK